MAPSAVLSFMLAALLLICSANAHGDHGSSPAHPPSSEPPPPKSSTPAAPPNKEKPPATEAPPPQLNQPPHPAEGPAAPPGQNAAVTNSFSFSWSVAAAVVAASWMLY